MVMKRRFTHVMQAQLRFKQARTTEHFTVRPHQSGASVEDEFIDRADLVDVENGGAVLRGNRTQERLPAVFLTRPRR